MEPIQYVRTIRRRWKLIAAFVLVGLVLGYVSSIGAQKKHDETTYWRATNTLYYDGSAVTDKGGPYTQLAQMGLLATAGSVPAQIAQNRGVNPTALATRLATETNTSQSTVKITATGQDADDTVALANEIGDGLMKFVHDQNQAQYDADVQDALNKVDGLKKQIADIDATNPAPNSVEAAQREALSNQLRLALDNELQIASQGAPKDILKSFQPPEAIPINGSQFAKFVRAGALNANNTTIGPNDKSSTDTLDATLNPKSTIPTGPIPRTLIGGFIGLLIGLAAAFVWERLDNRVQSKEDAELAFELPVLCEVPPLTRAQTRETEVLSQTHPLSRTAEAYRALRSSLVFLDHTLNAGVSPTPGQKHTQVILVTSAGPSEGKTTTVANLAAMFAEADNSVLVINCDFRRPRLHRFLGGSDEPRKVVQSEIEGVRMVNNVLSNPNPNPAEVAAAQRQVVEAARGMFDVILLDTAPLLSTNDASEIMSSADVVVLVSQAGKTSKASAARATEILQRMEATVAGVALLGARYVPTAQYYYYANDNSQNLNRAEAESHPLDLLIRTDTGAHGSANGSTNGSTAEPTTTSSDATEAEAETADDSVDDTAEASDTTDAIDASDAAGDEAFSFGEGDDDAEPTDGPIRTGPAPHDE
jgi:Mrp family chromosome partitioning ATPase/capsular polysaccharide biosynthesis protein